MAQRALPGAWEAALATLGISLAGATRADGRVTLQCDRHRLDLFAQPSVARVLLCAELLPLPVAEPQRSELMDRALRWAAGQLAGRHDTLAWLPDAGALALQRGVDDDLEPPAVLHELGDFLCACDGWVGELAGGGRR